MAKSLMAAFLIVGVVGFAGAGVAHADDDCAVPLVNWQPRDTVQKMAEQQGWTVRRIKIDDGCYEIKGLDAQGRRIKVKVDPGTLAIVEMKFDDRADRDADSKVNRGEAATPPNNGLFNQGGKPGVEGK